MSEEDGQKWNQEGRHNEVAMSPSCSSFAVLDPHDPVISRLATQLFVKTNEYLQGEMAAGQEHYSLLEDINRMAITKFADLKNLVINITKTTNESTDYFNDTLAPVLQKIDEFDEQTSKFEATAYLIDAYTKQLLDRCIELEEESHNRWPSSGGKRCVRPRHAPHISS